MSSRRASEKRDEEPVEDGLLQLLDLIPLKIVSAPGHETPSELTSECQRLTIYRNTLGVSKSFPVRKAASFRPIDGDPFPVYTGVHHQLSDQSVVLRRKANDANDILKLLNKCDHPNVLKPSGVWEGDDMVCLTFALEGMLSQIDENELFIVDSGGKKDGFTNEGQKVFRNLISATHHINEMAYNGTPPPLLPLQLVPGRIFYQKIESTGGYHVLVGDFYGNIEEDQKCLPKTLRRDLNSIRRFNWKSLGEYLGTLIGNKGNEELNHLRDVLKGPSTYEDILWEPALWDSAVKMHFVREVYFSIHLDSKHSRAVVLKKKPSLGLHDVIKLLGLTFTDSDLLGSVNFLRNKVVAHQDEAFNTYTGNKLKDVGLKKSTLERFILKNKPNYMLKLVEHIRPLNWIPESPLLRSKTTYMKVLKPV